MDTNGPTQGVLVFKDKWLLLVPNTEDLLTLQRHIGKVTHVSALSSSTHRLNTTLVGKSFKDAL